MWYLDEVEKCDLRRMGMQNLHVCCNSAGFEKGELLHVIHQYSISGSQVLQNMVVLHYLILPDSCQGKLLVGCSIEVMIAAVMDGLFDY